MRYAIGFLVTVGMVVLAFVLVLRGFGGDEAAVQTELTDYTATQTVMRMTIDGPVNADQEHRAARVTVGRSNSAIDFIQGYEGHILETRSYESNEKAYGTFLRALDLLGYTRGDAEADAARRDSRGVCPTGKVYTFEIITGSDTVQRYWTTSCGGGTFGGNEALIRQLFRAQIPDYLKIVRGTGLQ